MPCCGDERKSKKAKTSAACPVAGKRAQTITKTIPDSSAPPRSGNVSIERWLGRGWLGVPDPIRRHVARSLGLRKIPPMSGCGCLVALKSTTEDWADAGGTKAHVAAAVAWLAPHASAACSIVLSVRLLLAPPSEPLRRLLAQATRAAAGTKGTTTQINISVPLEKGVTLHGLMGGARVGDVLSSSIRASAEQAGKKAGAAGVG